MPRCRTPFHLFILTPLDATASHNQSAKWGGSIVGTLSPFDFQPKNAGFAVKALNENSKS